jgi:hypothetical protein
MPWIYCFNTSLLTTTGTSILIKIVEFSKDSNFLEQFHFPILLYVFFYCFIKLLAVGTTAPWLMSIVVICNLTGCSSDVWSTEKPNSDNYFLCYGCYHPRKGTSRCTQTSNTPCSHTSCKVHWCWWWNFWKCIILSILYQLVTWTINTSIRNSM